MRIGIDFGTSYSAAGAQLDGVLQLVRFGAAEQFRTTVFFPQRLPDAADFVMTPALHREVAGLVQVARREQAAHAARVRNAREAALRLPESRRAAALALVPRELERAEPELRRDAEAAVRRRWLEEQARQVGSGQLDMANALYGEDAVDAYIASGSGQLVVSPKSMLGYRLHGSARQSLLAITSHILRHIRETAGAQFGATVDAAVLGRPVEFRSSMGDAGGVQALAILREAAAMAGFVHVEFLEEPSAAALGHHRRTGAARRTLVVDVGGGTTDVALADVGGDRPVPGILRAWGLAQGGTDVDIELSMRAFMPLCGKDRTPTPVHHYYQAAAVHDLERQRAFRQARFDQVAAPYAARLARLQHGGTTIRLNRGVEQAKIALSASSAARVDLDYLEEDLVADVARERLDEAAERFIASLHGLLATVDGQLERPPEVVFATGGMSRAPYVRMAIARVFPDAAFIAGDASLGVVTGLAAAASHPVDTPVPGAA
ncbi:MAG TPA: Hsp70 family protein [Luteimonas sp.]|nr:Hsp70 family protein [Luteimonas sp.]